jgi:hypothetical protein
MIQSEVLPHHVTGKTKESNKKKPHTIISLQTNNWSQDLPNKKQECYPLNYNIQ